MKAYCITLKDCNDRQITTAEVLKRANISVEFFIGVDARVDTHPLLERFRERTFLLNMGRPGAIGEAGCYASHYLMWEKCVELNEPIIVFEDDFDIDERMFCHSLEIAKAHINDCGYIRIENTCNHDMFYQVRTYGDQRLVKYLKIPQCMTGYAISPKTAKAFIEHSKTFDYPVDVFLRNAWIHKQPIFGVCQSGLWGGNKPSVIGNRKRQGKKDYFVATMKIVNKIKNMTLNLATNFYHLKLLGSDYKPTKLWKG
ncbi:glycosyltransferase family 25 protein [Vibrio sp. SCSIO 43135]|uniref:glycosyltransferase family 25 protein n=1 Tax=Vibrio sp. SCSIO 43135 TaxID=2819096 RepID=UPI00207587BD|nr:glycosyltransferase family 25 protein [Vibrio sp. SCSIO 43135]USD41269.1 glycosyltransferase family 25 protein [Vibrio sp. SCSIO 43135]